MPPRKSYLPIRNIYRGESSLGPRDGWVGILEKDPNLIHFVRWLRSEIHGWGQSGHPRTEGEIGTELLDIPDINVKLNCCEIM